MIPRLLQAWTQQLLSALRGPDLHGCLQAHCPMLPATPAAVPDQPLTPGVAT